MRELRRNATLPNAPPGAARGEPVVAAEAPSQAAAASDEVVVLSHEALFVEIQEPQCDVCGVRLPEDESSEGYRVPGRGVYLWARGDETRLESVPLCASCASAIGMTALARWEIEEEEG